MHMTLVAGRYALGELLGTGGMSVVHAAVDERLARPVAVKLLKPEMAARDDVRRRFETEARWAARLSHPHAVAVYDTGEDDGVPFLFVERLPGQTLHDRIAEGPVDVEWLRRTGLDVLGALAAAHVNGIVHRDVKPGNILLTAEGRAKVADFGIAKSLGLDSDSTDLTRTGQLVGTPSYLAPERLDGADATPRSDIYSLGVVLYEAVTGRKPFTGPNALAVAFAIKHDDPVPLAELRPDADAAFLAAVERAMARDPDERFASADDMAQALDPDATLSPVSGISGRESTVVMGREEGTAVMTAAPTSPTVASSRRIEGAPVVARHSRTALVLLVAGLLVLAAVGIAAALTGNKAGSTGAGSTLAATLRDDAVHVAVGDGPMGPEAARRLRAVADEVEQGDGGALATALIRHAKGWNASRQLSNAALQLMIRDLGKVPGADTSVAAPPPPTVVPVTEAPRAEHPPKGKGKHGRDD